MSSPDEDALGEREEAERERVRLWFDACMRKAIDDRGMIKQVGGWVCEGLLGELLASPRVAPRCTAEVKLWTGLVGGAGAGDPGHDGAHGVRGRRSRRAGRTESTATPKETHGACGLGCFLCRVGTPVVRLHL
jgi:hypothetical protein